MTARLPLLWLIPVLALCLVGCDEDKKANDTGGQTGGDTERVTWQMVRDGSVKRTNPDTGVTWTLVGIRTDKGNAADAKQKAEDALSAHPELDGLVGLYAYNPPALLQAVEERKILDKVKIVGFDEDPATLDAIREGKIVGTIVQNPYEFGFRSVELLSAKIRDQEIDMPKNGQIFVPTRAITGDNVDGFSDEIKQIRAGNGYPPKYDADQYDTAKSVKMHFVANLYDPFWKLAEQGCARGATAFNAEVGFYIPPTGQVSEQKSYVDSIIIDGTDGLAISVRNPDGQVQMINEWAKKIKVIAVDSDAPESDRLFYLGTNNADAGRQAGDLLAKVLPEGGEVMIFVGELTQANARQRAQGVIDALLGQ